MDPTSCHSGNGTRPVNTGLLYIQAVSRADVAQQRAKSVELFLFFWQMRLLLSCCRSVNQEACLGFVWSGTRSGCTINHYQFSSSSFFLFFSFLFFSFFCRSERASSSQHVLPFSLVRPRVEMCLIGCLCHEPAVCRLVGRARPLCNSCGPVPKQNRFGSGFYFYYKVLYIHGRLLLMV